MWHGYAATSLAPPVSDFRQLVGVISIRASSQTRSQVLTASRRTFIVVSMSSEQPTKCLLLTC